MRFCSLGSGSGGNATLVEAGSGAATRRLLIDCGFSLRELEMRLARIGLACSDLHAVFITHEHGDHVGCATTLVRRHRLPLWLSRGTWRAIRRVGVPGTVVTGPRSIAAGRPRPGPWAGPRPTPRPRGRTP